MHIPGAYLGLTVNIQVGAICNILTISHKNSILDAYGSPRYKPAYLATKYIKRKNQKNQTHPPCYILTICIPISKSICFIVSDGL